MDSILVKQDIERIRRKVWGKKAPPPVKRKKSGIGVYKTTEMSDYFNYDQYDRATRAHAFYQEMLALMIKKLKSNIKNSGSPYRILELGCGNGSLTDILVTIKNVEITSLDVDKNAIAFVEKRLKKFKNLRFVRMDALKYRSPDKFDAIIASWNYEHITNYNNGPDLGKSVAVNLKKNGVYIKGAEIIAPFENEQERQRNFVLYHEDIIDRALKDGNQDTAEIEYLAMISGITKVSHFKRDEKTVIEEMKKGGLKLISSKKVGPFTKKVASAGNYVMEYKIA